MQFLGLESGTREGNASDRNVHTGGSEMVAHWGFCLVVKIERPGGYGFISSDELKRGNDSFTTNEVDVRGCGIEIDL